RAAGGPFLAHEQKRCGRRAEQQGRGSTPRGEVDLVVQPLAEDPVADLVVVLQTDDEAARRQAGGIRAAGPLQVLGELPAEEPAVVDGRNQVGNGAPEIAVVALAVAGQQAPYLVVKVVGPDAIEAPAAVGHGPDDVSKVAMILGYQMDGSPWPSRVR